MKFTHTTPFKRFMLSLAVVGFVDLLLFVFTAMKGTPRLGQILQINLWILAILLLRAGISLFLRLRCPSCGQARGQYTGSENSGYALVKCPKCGSVWIV